MEHGHVTNWEDMEQVWESVFKEHLKVEAEEVPPRSPPDPDQAPLTLRGVHSIQCW